MAEQDLPMIPDEDQRLLEKTAAQFFAQHSPADRVRKLRDGNDPLGYSRDLWSQMAELGWCGLHIPEEYGGMGMSFFDLCLVVAQAGKTLAPEPFLSAVLASETLVAGGSDAQKSEWLPKIAGAEAVIATAYLEARSRFDVSAIDATATKSSDGFVLEGTKVHVCDAVGADAFLVSAKLDGAVAVFVVAAGTKGITVTRGNRIDGRNAATVKLDAVEVPASALVPGGVEALKRGIDYATIALSAEMLGGADEAFTTTVEYIKVRKQFGAPLGSFQALQHRAARVYIALELARSAVLAAARAADLLPQDLARYASLAKAKMTDAYLHSVNEAVQMHGGVGVTDECNVGFYLKRARAAESTFGNAAFHHARWATVNGY